MQYALGQESSVYKGRVVSDGKGLANVQISLVPGKQLLAVTDSTGNFTINSLEKEPIFRFEMPGYYSLEMKLTEFNNVIWMYPDVNLLEQVVISESKTEKAIKRSTITLERIEPSLIENTAPISIEQSINRINGVQIVDNQANIRSGSGWSYGAGSRVQVLVNGIPMLSGDAASAQWSFIPTEGIESVEILKGAASVIYGSSALNGVININTKSHSKDPFTSVSFSTGGYSKAKRKSLDYNHSTNLLANVSAFHLGKIESLDYSLALNMLHDDGYKMNDGEQRARLSFGVRKVLPKKNLVIGLNNSFQMGNSNSFLLWENYELGYTSLDSGYTKGNTSRIAIDPYVKWSKAGNHHKITGRYLHVGNAVDNGDTSIDLSNFSDWGHIEYQYNRKLKLLNISLVSGVVHQNSVTKSPLFSGKQNTSNTAAFLQLEKQMKKLLLSAGMRYEYYTLNARNLGKPVFRAGANFEATKATFIRGSIGQGFRFPSVAECYVTTSVGPVNIYPNPDLNPEKGYSWELGVKQGIAVRKFKALLDLAYYQMHFDQMTEFLFAQWGEFKSFSDLGLGFKAINAGKTKVSGMELSSVFQQSFRRAKLEGFIGYNYAKGISLEPEKVIANGFYGTALSYASSSSTSEGNVLKYRPKHSLKADLMYRFNGFSLGYGVSWQSAIANIDTAFISPPISFIVPGVDSAMKMDLTAFVLHNIRFGYSVNSRLNLNIIISNLANKEYMIRPADLGPPRSVRFQISYTFKAKE